LSNPGIFQKKVVYKKFRACLELIRPPNIVTAFADILGGFFIAGGAIIYSEGSTVTHPEGLHWLLFSTIGLYGGGITFNDVFDAGLDAIERPDRAIPSGRISRKGAAHFGSALLASGVYFAFVVNITAGLIAVGISACALIYDAFAKYSVFFGPFVMGSCRGGNLLLGCSIMPSVLFDVWFLVFIPVIYIGAITLVSKGEVHGGYKLYGFLSVGFISLVIVAFLVMPLLFDSYYLTNALAFILLLATLVLPPFLSAAFNPEPATIRKAVKRGVLCLVLINSIFAAGFAGFLPGILVLLLFIVSITISKYFKVT